MPNANSVVEISSSASGRRETSGSTSAAGIVEISSSAVGGHTTRFSVMKQRINVLGENEGIATHSWWEHTYVYRRRINVVTPFGEDVANGHPVTVDLPLTIVTGGKVRKDFEDIEVIYATGGELHHLYREVRVFEGKLQVAFQIYEDIDRNTSLEQYYIYYGNPTLDDAIRRPLPDFEWVVSSSLPEDLNLPDSPIEGAPENFLDVTPENLFYEEIMWMLNHGIAIGFSDGNFYRDNEVTRGIGAIFLYRMFGSPEGPFPDPNFSDITGNDELAKAVAWMAYRGVTTGYRDGTYRPDEDLSRGVLAIFLHRLMGIPTPETDSKFSDIFPWETHYNAVVWGSEEDIFLGYDDFTFRPDNPVLRQQMASFLFRFVNKSIGLFVNDRETSVLNRSEWPARTGYKSDMITYTRPGEHWIEGASSTRHSRASSLLYAEHIRVISRVGPDQAIMEVQIDGSDWKEVDLFDLSEQVKPVYSNHHLSPQIHEIRLRVSGKSAESSLGESVNIDSLEYFKSIRAFDIGEDVISLFWKTSIGGS